MLSSLQYEIGCIEKELDKLDEWEMKTGNPDGRLTCRQTDDKHASKQEYSKAFQSRFNRTRPELLTELKAKLMEYGMRFPRPTGERQ